MNKYTLGKQKTLAELCEKKDARIKRLEVALNDLLNDCINFDGSKLSEWAIKQAAEVLKQK